MKDKIEGAPVQYPKWMQSKMRENIEVSKSVQIVCVCDDINNNDTLLHFIFGTDCPLHLANL